MNEYRFSTVIRTLVIQAKDLNEAEEIYDAFWDNESHPQVIEDDEEVYHLVQDIDGVLIG
mgnify:CR=1 FL=1